MSRQALCCSVLLLLAWALPPSASAQAADPPTAPPAPSEFGIRDTSPPTGSNIRRDRVAGGSIPVNRSYAQMSDAEKAAVHAMYERIEPGDEPPFPLQGLKPIYEAVAKGQDRRLVTGLLTLAAEVDPQGGVTRVLVLDNPDPALTRYVASVLFNTAFKPALCKGRPCTMQYPVSIQLTTRPW